MARRGRQPQRPPRGPFPTALLGETLFTPHASLAVVLYTATGALMAFGWALIGWSALGAAPLTRSERALAQMRQNTRNAYSAFGFYGACTIVALWQPLAIAVVITGVWTYWLIYGMRAGKAHAD